MKKTLIIVGSLIIIIGLAGGIWYWQKNKSRQVFNNTPVKQISTSTSQPTSTQQEISLFSQSAQDKLAGLKTYTNTKYGFEFKYPVSWDNVVYSEDGGSAIFLNDYKYVSLYDQYGGLTPDLNYEYPDYGAVEVIVSPKGSITGSVGSTYAIDENTDLKKEADCNPKYLTEFKLLGAVAYLCSYNLNGYNLGRISIKINGKGDILSIDYTYGDNFKDFKNLSNAFNTIASTFEVLK
ncbi:hypothetical protein HZB05_00170 [Candidatus Wolfebacteria bacterium]|nr:hypothetical protein [Candidatus Wolfebacteria bacterium]